MTQLRNDTGNSADDDQVDSAWWIYMVSCADDSLYTGVARNLDARIAEHNAGQGARYTRSRLPVALVYSEPAASRSAAQQREYAIKQLNRRDKLTMISRGGDKRGP